MASILDNLRDNRGIRILDTQLNSSSAMAGAYDILYHTNGYIYVAFARNSLDYPVTALRHIWMARSTDGGTTFETPVKITEDDGKWHDSPALLQIDPTSTTSSIGVVLTKQTDWQDRLTPANIRRYPYRVLVSPTLELESAVDQVATYKNIGGLTVVRGTSSFQIYALSDSLDYVTIYENAIVLGNTADGFTNNAWTARVITNFAGAGKNIRSLKVRRLLNGDLALVGAVETAVTDELPLCNVGLSFSSDDGNTWSSIQYMTNFTGTPAIDLAGLTGAVEADLAEVSANQLAIVYQEGTPAQILSNTSTPATPSANTVDIKYHAGKDALFIADYSDGVYVYDCASQTVIFHFTASSTPPVWSLLTTSIDISSDGKYLAVGTQADFYSGNPGCLDVFDISDATPANWTVVASLRNTTTPVIKGTGISWLQFVDDTHIAYANNSGDTDYSFGGILDLSDITITYIASPLSSTRGLSARSRCSIDVSKDGIYAAVNNYTWKSKISDGTLAYYYYLSGSPGWSSIAFDPVNEELIVALGTKVYRFSDTGSAISLLETITSTSNPYMPESANSYGYETIGTGGLLISVNQMGNIWYDFHSKKVTGALVTQSNPDPLGYDPPVVYTAVTKIIKNDEWLITFGGDAPIIHMQPIKESGKLRWGIFTYTPATKMVSTTSDDFHLLCDTNWVSANDALHLVKPRISAAPLGNVFLTALRYYPQVSGINLITGVMNREHLTIGMKAAIAKKITNTVTSRARIYQNPTKTVNVRARMVFAQCIKVMAYIMPKQVKTLQLKASVLNLKSTHFTSTFNVNFVGMQKKLRLQFIANTGYTGLQTYTSKARIVKSNKKRFTGHYLVSGNPTTGTITFEATTVSYSYKIGMKAFLVSNR